MTNVSPEFITDFDFYFEKGIQSQSYIGVFRHRFVAAITSGSIFGELGILMDHGRSASIVAAQDTELAVFGANYYRNILKDGDLKKI